MIENIVQIDDFKTRKVAKEYVNKFIQYDVIVAVIWLSNQNYDRELFNKYTNKEFIKRGIE